MNEENLQVTCQKLCNLNLIRSFYIVDRNGIPSNAPLILPSAILQNTKARIDSNDSKILAHWVLGYIDKNKNYEFWDSLGHSPYYYDIVIPFQFKNLNSIQYQANNSVSCGLFCVFFLAARSLGYTLCDIHQVLGRSYLENDRIVKEFCESLVCSNDSINSFKRIFAYYKSIYKYNA